MTDNNIFENDPTDQEQENDSSIVNDQPAATESEKADEMRSETFTPQVDDMSRGSYVHENENGCTYHSSSVENTNNAYVGAHSDFMRSETPKNSTPRTEVYINRHAETDAHFGQETPKKAKGQHRSVTTIVLVAVLCVVLSGFAAFGGTYLANSMVDDTQRDSVSVIYKNTSGYSDNSGISNTDSTVGKIGTYADVAEKVASSVVEIRTETVSTSSIFSQYITEGAGSGVVITSDGYIITNNHVIDGASTVTVTMNDGTSYPAEVIGSDSESDLAVIKIDATGLTPAVVGDSSKLVVGEEVIAIGNPLGSLGGTVTNGIISALARQVTIDGTEMTLLQTNAAVNPGNSGGGLFNLAGELVGIVNAKSSGSGIEGLGFAIPSDIASTVVEQLINYGYVRGRVSLGISYMDISDSYTAMMYRVNTLGVYILESEYNDELKIGDRVTAVDGTEVTYGSDIKAILKDHEVGDKITLTVVRDGKYVDVEMECHEYVPGKAEADEDKTENNSFGDIFKSPFSSWFGY